jgi:hypothetical protein
MNIGSVIPRSQEVLVFWGNPVDWSPTEGFPHMPLRVVSICKSYNLIFTDCLFVECNIPMAVDTPMTKKNSRVRTFHLVRVRRKTVNNTGLKREPREYSLSNISGYASEFILSLLRPILPWFYVFNISILKNGLYLPKTSNVWYVPDAINTNQSKRNPSAIHATPVNSVKKPKSPQKRKRDSEN